MAAIWQKRAAWAALGSGLCSGMAGMAIAQKAHSGQAAHGATSSAASGAKKTALPTIAYKTFTLPNGLQVITHEDHRLPLVAVDLWYHVGPLNERPGRTGFAHLFEHMMFEGSEHVGEKAHIKYVQSAGATDVNGTTDFDRTNYFETMPKNQLELALWLESDRMGFLMEGLDREKLTNQRDVVRNERRQGEGRPYEVAGEEVYHLLFPKGHPYYGSVIGSHQDIESARIADVRDFHQQFYTPNNATLAVAGDFDPETLRMMLTKYFGPIPAGPKVEPVNVPTPPITSQKRETVTDTVKLPQVRIAWLTPARFTPDAYNVEAAAFALGEGRASRLDQALVIKNQVAQRVSCDSNALKLTGITECDITAKPGVKLEDLEATFWSELAKIQSEGPTAEEIESAKALDLTQKITGLQRLGGFGGVADTLNLYNQYTGDPGYLPKDVAAAEAVTPSSARMAAAKYLTRDKAVVVYCVPGKKVLDDVPRSPENTDADVKLTNPYTPEFEQAQNWRKTAPAPGPMPAVHLPVPVKTVLPNGLTVMVLEDHALPVLSVTMATRAGSEYNPADKGGLASLTAQLVGEATTTRDVTALSEAQERIGTRIGVGASMDGATAGMTLLTNYTDRGLDLFSDVVQHPAFSDSDLDRLRKQRLVSIGQETDSVQAMAMRVGPKLVFGDTPYGASPMGTTASVSKLTRADVQSFYQAHYAPADTALVFAGDVTVAQARELAQKYFGSWSGTASPMATIPAAAAVQATRVVIVDKPGAPQTALFAYGTGVPANSPELPTLLVMNYTLGGSFASRINMNLREQHGYTYGANSRYGYYRAGGDFVAGGLVRTDITGPAATELMKEIRNFPTAAPTDAEMTAAKSSLVQSLPGQFATTQTMSATAASLFLFDRPLDYYATLPAKVQAVTGADVQRVSQQDLHPENLVIVAAGDRAKIEPQLKDANVGPVEVRDIDGNLVSGK